MSVRFGAVPLGVAVLGVLLHPVPAPLAAQEFEGVLLMRAKGMPGGTMKGYVKSGKYRMEISVEGRGDMVIIADPAAGETYMVMPSQSMYMVMKMADMERGVDSLIRREVGEGATLTPTGKKEAVAGRSCEVFRYKDSRSEMDLCLARELGAFKGAEAFFGGRMTPGRTPQAPPWVREMLRQGAFPLKVSETSGEVIWEVLSMEKRELEAALFVPPANFRRMEMPGFGRPPG